MGTAINHLLSHTRMLRAYEQKLREATGEHFNIFEILRIGSYEVMTHSPMLAELLSPCGRHGMGCRFLGIFAKQLELRITEAAQVDQEYSIGMKNEDRGGRIDILIKDGKNTIIIENKIYAADQEKQITRYLKTYPNAVVLYLTLDGHNPCEEISDEEKKRFRCISYQKEIIEWLQACRKEAAHAPLVRETITQYINLIKTLTHQNTNSRMSNEITTAVLADDKTLEAYLTLVRSQQDVARKLEEKLREQIETVAKEMNLPPPKIHGDLGTKWSGFFFADDRMKERCVEVGFEFEGKNHSALCFGVRFNNQKDPLFQKLKVAFENVFGPSSSTASWPCYMKWPGHDDWWNENDKTFQQIRDGTFKADLRGKIQQLLGIVYSAINSQ